MPISPYLRDLRAVVGTRLLLLPSVAVLPRDDRGAVLLVRLVDSGEWATIGGMVEPDEDPEDAARREALEEAGVTVELRGILTVAGGPAYRIQYPSGDQAAYVSAVYDAVVVGGRAEADGDETMDARWFLPEELSTLTIGTLNHALLGRVGLLP